MGTREFGWQYRWLCIFCWTNQNLQNPFEIAWKYLFSYQLLHTSIPRSLIKICIYLRKNVKGSFAWGRNCVQYLHTVPSIKATRAHASVSDTSFSSLRTVFVKIATVLDEAKVFLA